MNRSLVEEKLICRVPHSIYRIGAIVLGLGSIGLIWCFEFWVPYEFRNYLFNVLQSTGSLFAWLLSIIFLVGVSVTLERIAFILVYSLWSTRIRFNGHNHSEKVMYDEAGDYGGVDHNARNYTIQYIRACVEFSNDGGKHSIDIRSQGKLRARDLTLDGEDLRRGIQALEVCALLAPTIGFMGTLTGLVQAFSALGSGAGLNAALSGLGVSMTTSLIGAGLYVLFILEDSLLKTWAASVEDNAFAFYRHYLDLES